MIPTRSIMEHGAATHPGLSNKQKSITVKYCFLKNWKRKQYSQKFCNVPTLKLGPWYKILNNS